MLADPCADPRIFARVFQARLLENSSNNVFVFFCPQLLQFYSGLSMGGQTFSMGEGTGRGGPNAYFRNP